MPEVDLEFNQFSGSPERDFKQLLTLFAGSIATFRQSYPEAQDREHAIQGIILPPIVSESAARAWSLSDRHLCVEIAGEDTETTQYIYDAGELQVAQGDQSAAPIQAGLEGINALRVMQLVVSTASR